MADVSYHIGTKDLILCEVEIGSTEHQSVLLLRMTEHFCFPFDNPKW